MVDSFRISPHRWVGDELDGEELDLFGVEMKYYPNTTYSYVGIMINHHKDPVIKQPVFQWKVSESFLELQPQHPIWANSSDLPTAGWSP